MGTSTRVRNATGSPDSVPAVGPSDMSEREVTALVARSYVRHLDRRAKERRVHLLRVVARLVVVGMILHTEIQERNALGMERCVIGRTRPVVARLEIVGVVAVAQGHTGLAGDRSGDRFQRRRV